MIREMRLKTVCMALLVMLGLLLPITGYCGKMEDDILELVNEYRKDHNLPPLKINNSIEASAEKHSKNMASGRVPFGHSGFDNRLDGLLKKLKGSNAGAENVAYGSRTAKDVVKMWINSKGHRKNILGNYNLTGIGVAKAKNGTPYYTQIFIRQK